jgi:hypothetical protein
MLYPDYNATRCGLTGFFGEKFPFSANKLIYNAIRCGVILLVWMRKRKQRKDRMQLLDQLTAMIPEESENEALNSIQSITKYPPDSLMIRCHLAHKFSLRVQILHGQILIFNDENDSLIMATEKDKFLSDLSKAIYDVDAQIEAGILMSRKRSPFILPDSRPAPPSWMDIPVWDEELQRWYDAEY